MYNIYLSLFIIGFAALNNYVLHSKPELEMRRRTKICEKSKPTPLASLCAENKVILMFREANLR